MKSFLSPISADPPTHQGTAARCSPGTPQVSRGTPPGRSSPPAPRTSAVECGSPWRSSANSWTRCPTTTSWRRPPSPPVSSAAPPRGLRGGDREERGKEAFVLFRASPAAGFQLAVRDDIAPPPQGNLGTQYLYVCVEGVICREGWTGTQHRCLSASRELWPRPSQHVGEQTGQMRAFAVSANHWGGGGWGEPPLGCFFSIYSHA